jgi:hypothetical protein
MVNRRRGMGGLGCLLTLVFLVAVGWFGYHIGTKYWAFYQFQDRMKSEARFAQHRGDPLIRSRLKLYADSLKLPEGASNVTVRRRRGTIHIFADYYEIIEFPGFVREVHFHPEAVGTF